MQGYNYNKPQPSGPFDQASTQMQLDEGSRQGVAQFFGDPQSRQFIQDSGNVQTAISRPDNPWGIPPIDSSMAGSPAYQGGQPQQPAPPAAQVTPQATQTTAQGQPQPPVATPGASYPTPGQPNPQPGATPGQFQTPVQSRQDYLQQNPAPVPARPTSTWDTMSNKQRALTSIFLAMNKIGASVDHNPNSYADQFFGNVMNTRQAQTDYDKNLPNLTSQAQDAWYQKYLGQQHQAADVQNMNSEIDMRNRGMNPTTMNYQGQIRDKLTKLNDAWTKDPRWLNNPEGFKRAANQELYGLNVDPSMLGDIMKQDQVSDKYSVDYSKEGGVPIGLKDNLGRPIAPSDIPALNDETANKVWSSAVAGHKQNVGEKENQARLSAQYRGDFGRMQTVYNNKTGMSRTVDGLTAQNLTGSGEWSAADPNAARSKWALYGDVTSAANNLNTSLPNRAMSPTEIAQIATAVKEYHGPIEEALKSQFLKGMKPDAQQVAANMLSMRDQLIVLPQTAGIPVSDTRFQALANAAPSPADLSNPGLAQKKMLVVYRMIHNLQEGIQGSPETFGITNQNKTGGNQSTDQQWDDLGNQPVKQKPKYKTKQ